MSNILQYTPKLELDASQRVEDFIEFCKKNIHSFGTQISWTHHRWDITQTHPKPGRADTHSINWFSLSKIKGCSSNKPMAQPFGDFARALILYFEGENHRSTFCSLIRALRIIEKALLDRSPDGEVRIERLDTATLDHCIEIIRNRYPAVYENASEIASINRFLERFGLVAYPSGWINPIARPRTISPETDDKIIENRNKKLPSEAVFNAYLEIFSKGNSSRNELTCKDQIVTAIGMIIAAAPERISETVDIWNECDVWRELPGNPRELCLRWFPNKGGKPQLKPVPMAWAPVVEEAIKRLRKLSTEARNMARWYEKHPSSLSDFSSAKC